MAARKLAPIHPGEVLALDFLEPLGLSQYRLAKDISVPARRINDIDSPRTSACQPVASMRLCTALARFPQIPRSDSPAISAPVTASGSICRPGLISRWSATISARSSRRKFEFSTALANERSLRQGVY
jgi:addiction module HigA family antidote